MAHPLAFVAFLRHVGAPAGKYLRLQGLPALCEDPDLFVSLERTWAFFDSASRSVDPMLGWHVGKFAGDRNLNAVLRRKLEQAPTLYRALQELVRLARSEASEVQIGIGERRDDIILHTQYPERKGAPGYSMSQAYKLGVFIDLIRHFAGERWMPDEIGIDLPSVPSITEEHFPGTRILMRQNMAYVSIPRSLLHLAAQRGDSADDACGDPPLASSFDYMDTLRTLLRPYLSEGYPDALLAASLMDTSVRSLARKLSDSGLSYRTMIDELRFTEARELLKDPAIPIIEVAAAVGFDDPSHFARMFRRIGGICPREFRKSLTLAR